MTPQGLSRAIHSLESEFGVSLINRTSNSISISCAGQEFACHARQIIEAYEGAQQAMRGHAMRFIDFSSPDISVIATPFFFTYLFPFLDDLLQQKFSFSLKFSEANVYRLLPRISKAKKPGTVGILSRPRLSHYDEFIEASLSEENLCYEPLMRIELQAMVSSSAPFAAKERITHEDVKHCPIACFNDTVLIDALTSILGEDNITLITNNQQAITHKILQDHTISFVPAIRAASGLPENIVLKPVENIYTTEIGFVATPSNYLDIKAQNAMAYVREFFEENSDHAPFKGTYEMIDHQSS